MLYFAYGDVTKFSCFWNWIWALQIMDFHLHRSIIIAFLEYLCWTFMFFQNLCWGFNLKLVRARWFQSHGWNWCITKARTLFVLDLILPHEDSVFLSFVRSSIQDAILEEEAWSHQKLKLSVLGSWISNFRTIRNQFLLFINFPVSGVFL